MKTRLAYLILILSLGVVILISCQSDNSKPVSLGDIDSLNIVNMDSASLQFTKADLRNSLLTVIFNPRCDHCRAQAEDIYNNIGKLTDVTILMIGSVPMEEIKEFSVKYGLNNFSNVIFSCANPVVLHNKYGAVPMPYLRLYDRNIKFVKDFKSFTPVIEILSYVG